METRTPMAAGEPNLLDVCGICAPRLLCIELVRPASNGIRATSWDCSGRQIQVCRLTYPAHHCVPRRTWDAGVLGAREVPGHV